MLNACGGSKPNKEDVPPKKLYLVDSFINGVEYECGVYKGLTGFKDNTIPIEAGRLTCTDVTITFSISPLLLGKVEKYNDGDKIYPQTLFGKEKNIISDEVLNWSLFIQSLADGNITESINISKEMRAKIKSLNRNSINWKKRDEVLEVLEKLEVKPKDIKEVERHLRLNTDSPYIEEKNLSFEVKDNIAVGTELKKLIIHNGQNIEKINIDNAESEYFNITSDGRIILKKELDYKKQITHSFHIQSEGKATSNFVTINIKVNASSSEEMEAIEAPLVVYPHGYSKIYTKDSSFTVQLQGRKDTKISIDGNLKDIMPSVGTIALNENIKQENHHNKYNIRLSYDNGDHSIDTELHVIHDNTNPTIKTLSIEDKNENILEVKTIEVEDNFKDEGLAFSLSGGVDKSLFTILPKRGVLSFRSKVDHENPQDSNKNNIYEIEVTVKDRVGNPAKKLYKIKVLNQESVPSIETFTTSISDSTTINTTIGTLSINHENSSIKSIVFLGEDTGHFKVNNEGVISLAKNVFYQSKNRYQFEVQATNDKDEKSNKAIVIINITSATAQIMNEIEAPTITYEHENSKIYTNTNIYSFKIEGRKGTNIYLDDTATPKGVIAENGTFILTQDIEGADRNENHTIHLGYDNAVISNVSNFTVIKDTIAPNITTPLIIDKEENIKLITNIVATDTNEADGFEFTLEDEKDAQYFSLNYAGELSFKSPANFEEPLDENKNNEYEVTIKVTDKANNSSTLNLTVKVIDVLDSKPSIEAFEEDITISSVVGTTIGRVSIHEGNSPLLDVNLTGTGSEYFDINHDGTLRLISRVSTPTTFTLEVSARNEFGTSTQTISINVLATGIIAKAQMGRLSGATVKIIKINRDNSQELIHETTTNSTGSFQQIGNFDMQPDLLEDDEFYLYEVTEGYDIDVNDDGIEDDTSTENKGVMRLIAKGSWIKNATHKIRVTPLSEFLYDYMAKYVKYDYNQIESKLNAASKILISNDLNEDGNINAKDIMIFNPIEQQSELYATLKYDNSYAKITTQLREGNQRYTINLFRAYTIDNLSDTYYRYITNNMIFSMDVRSGEFRIHNLKNKNIIGKLSLSDPLKPISYDSNGEPRYMDFSTVINLYVDIKYNKVYITGVDSHIHVIDISTIKKPTLLAKNYDDRDTSFMAFVGNQPEGIKIRSSSNEKLYICYKYNCDIVDYTTPNQPKIISALPVGIHRIVNNKVYIYQHSYTHPSLKIYDISNPENIEFEFSLDERIDSFYTDGNYLYTSSYNYSSIDNTMLKIYNLNTISKAPELIGEFSTDGHHISNGNIIDIVGVKDQILYGYISDNIRLAIDISNPYKPYLVKQTYDEFGRMRFINNYFMSGHNIVDIKSLNFSYNNSIINNPSTYGYSASLAAIINNIAYFIDANGISKVDISNIVNPRFIKRIHKKNHGLEIINNILYIAVNNQIEIYDLNNDDELNSPIKIIDMKLNNSLRGRFYIDKDNIYILSYTETITAGRIENSVSYLQKINISNISSPNYLENFTLSSQQIGNITFRQNKLYMQVYNQKTKSYNIEVLDWNSTPKLIDKYDYSNIIHHYIRKSEIKDNYLFVNNMDTMDIFDISNQLKLVNSSYKSNGGYYNFFVEDNYLYRFTITHIEAVNLDTFNIVKKYNFSTIGIDSIIKVNNNFYIYNHSKGLQILDLNNMDFFNKSDL